MLGSTIHLNGAPMTIIGVAPATLDLPSHTAIWTPTLLNYEHLPKDGVFYGETIARLKDGVSLASANSRYKAAAAPQHPSKGLKPNNLELVSLQANWPCLSGKRPTFCSGWSASF